MLLELTFHQAMPFRTKEDDSDKWINFVQPMKNEVWRRRHLWLWEKFLCFYCNWHITLDIISEFITPKLSVKYFMKRIPKTTQVHEQWIILYHFFEEIFFIKGRSTTNWRFRELILMLCLRNLTIQKDRSYHQEVQVRLSAGTSVEETEE